MLDTTYGQLRNSSGTTNEDFEACSSLYYSYSHMTPDLGAFRGHYSLAF